MADTTVAPNPGTPKKRRKALRFLAWGLGVIVVLVVGFYFFATSAFFLKKFVLPKVGTQLNADVTVSDASISPFSEVVLRDLKVQPKGKETLALVPEVRLRYSLTAIMGGNIQVELISVSKPTVTLVEAPDGTSNLDPILKSLESSTPSEETKPDDSSSKPVQLDLRKLAVEDAAFKRIKQHGAGRQDVAEISQFSLVVENLRNGQTGKISVQGNINIANNPPAPGTNGTLRAKLDGAYTVALQPDLKPGSVDGKATVQVTEAGGALAMARGLEMTLAANVTPTEIKEVALRLAQSGNRLAELVASGPFDAQRTEGAVALRLANVDRQLLNLAGAANGLDFGPTSIGSSNIVQITRNGGEVAVRGYLAVDRLQVTRTNQTTPPMNLRADYDVAFNRAGSNALLVLRALNVSGTQRTNVFLRGSLAAPMTVAIGNTAGSEIGDSTFKLELTRLDLSEWRPFTGDAIPTGDVTGAMQATSQRGGKLVGFEVDGAMRNLSIRAETNLISELGLTFRARGKASNMTEFAVAEYRLGVDHRNKPVVAASGAVDYSLSTSNATATLNGQLMLAPAAGLAPQPDLSITSGLAEVKASLRQQQTRQDVTGAFSLKDFSGRSGSNSWANLGMAGDLDVGMQGPDLAIRKLAGKLFQGTNAGGGFEISGAYNTTNQAGRFRARMSDVNEHFVGPFLAAAMADKEVVSLAVNANSDIAVQPGGDASIKADLKVANFVVRDNRSRASLPALELGLVADASVSNQVTEIRNVGLALSPTELARTNQIGLSGRIDMRDTNAIQGNLKLASDALDITRFYDLFMGTNAAAEAVAASPSSSAGTSPAAAPSPQEEPNPIKLPFKNFAAQANIRHFYLGELQISNLTATAQLEGGRVKLEPVQLGLNGAPVNGSVDVDLGVRGFKYALAFSAVQVPYGPLVNTFVPHRRGQIGGTLTASGNISGQGVTDPSLQRNLRGKFDVATTNLNLAVQSLRSPLLRTVINVISIVPELVKNPGSAVGSLAGALFGGNKPATAGTGGWTEELRQSPIDVIQARGEIGPGPTGENRVNLEHAMIQSPVFQTYARGTVTLAPITTNSALQIPLAVSIRRSLAEKISLVPPGTPTNAAYAKLPEYVTIAGTLGKPEQKINGKALLGTALQQFGGKIPGVDEKTGSLIQGLGGLLVPKDGGNATNAPPGTNAPAGTNRTTAGPGGLLQGLGGLLGGPKTNSPGTNAPSATNQPSAGSLLDGLFGPGKK